METQHRFKQWTLGLAVFSMAWIMGVSSAQGQSVTYTLDADFDLGTLLNVNHDAPNHDQLQLNAQATPFPFINVAASSRGTIVRIDVNTGAIIGEYRTAPVGRPRNPSRTTVDQFGNVWAGNRDEASGGLGSVVKIGLIIGGTRVDANGNPDAGGQFLAPPFDYNTCVDRDNDGLIKTSMGLGNILGWPDVTDGAGGATGIVEDAEDECIQIFQRVNGDNVRHVSVDANNNVWTAGNFGADNAFDLLDGNTGAILASFDVGRGGYGGLVDGNGVLWSANRGPGVLSLLRYDTMGTITTADDTWSFPSAPNSYGLGLDSNGHIWHSQWTSNQIREYAPDGTLLNTYGTGGASNDRGVAVTPIDDNIWVANSGGSNVSRLAPNGALLKVIPLGGDGVTPTGVAVDSNGKVWATCLTSSTAKRIDPNAGGDGLGAVDLTVNLGAGAGPYNYSDMTGTVLLEAIQQGTWNVVYDSGTVGNTGCTISWNNEPEGAEPAGTSITVDARAADLEVNLPAEIFVAVINGSAPAITGQFIEVRATLDRDPGVSPVTPVLSDLTIQCCVPVEDPAPRTQGFWGRVCRGPHPSGEHENLPGYVDCVNTTLTFADVEVGLLIQAGETLCDRLHPFPKNDKCEKAEAQFMALLLNVCSGRVATCNCIDDPDLGQTTVGDAIDFIDGLLSNPARTFQDCVLAQAIADRLNNGLTLCFFAPMRDNLTTPTKGSRSAR